MAIDGVNQAIFGNSYSIGNSSAKQSKNSAASEESKASEAKSAQQNYNPEDVLNAMNITGLQNKIHVNSTSKELDADRVASIEAMMEEFDNGVNEVSEFIAGEFPGLSEADRNALAAAVFARE